MLLIPVSSKPKFNKLNKLNKYCSNGANKALHSY